MCLDKAIRPACLLFESIVESKLDSANSLGMEA